MALVSPECTGKLDLASQCITLPHQSQTSFAKADRGNPENWSAWTHGNVPVSPRRDPLPVAQALLLSFRGDWNNNSNRYPILGALSKTSSSILPVSKSPFSVSALPGSMILRSFENANGFLQSLKKSRRCSPHLLFAFVSFMSKISS
jgi:hypothetical protein